MRYLSDIHFLLQSKARYSLHLDEDLIDNNDTSKKRKLEVGVLLTLCAIFSLKLFMFVLSDICIWILRRMFPQNNWSKNDWTW